jgi:hypothetical protein
VTVPAGTAADAKAAAGAEHAAAVDEDAFDWDEDPAMCDATTPTTRYRILVVICREMQVLHVASAAARHIQRAGGEELVPHSEQPRDGGSAGGAAAKAGGDQEQDDERNELAGTADHDAAGATQPLYRVVSKVVTPAAQSSIDQELKKARMLSSRVQVCHATQDTAT